MKRLFTAILAALITASTVAVGPVSAESGIDLPTVDLPSDAGETDDPDFPDYPDDPDYPDNIIVSGDWAYEPVDGNAVIMGYLGSATELTIPSTIDKLPVTEIGDGALSASETLKSVIVPDSVTRIGEGAFFFSESLESITLPDTITSIGVYAFSGTSYAALLSNWNDGVLYIGKYLVEVEEALIGSITVANGTTLLADGVFDLQSNIDKITLPASLTSIGENTFIQCYALESIEVDGANEVYASVDGVLYSKDLTALIKCPGHAQAITLASSVTSIEPYAFSSCSLIESIVIPEGITELGEGVFSECTSLESVSLPDTLSVLGSGTFALCPELKSIVIPAKVTEIAEDTFVGCTALSEIKVAKENEVLADVDGALYDKNLSILITCPGGKTTLSVPEGVTEINALAFAYCTNLTSVILPNSLTKIGEGAFAMCEKLNAVTIPSGVTEIGPGAFGFCTGLDKVSLPGTLTNLGEGVFTYCAALKSIALPAGLTQISEGMFSGCSSLRTIVIPESVTYIGLAAFASTNLKTIHYAGSKDAWNSIFISEGNDEMMKAKIEFNSSGTANTPGDVNGDGNINAKDIIAVMRYILKPEKAPANFDFEAADMDGNGSINAKDVIAIMRQILKK